MDSIDVEEKKKMFELMKDRELGGNMDWMYRGDKPDSEEFLLGKSIDKLVSEATANEGSGSIFSERIKANVAMDMAAKMREDPLFAIRKKEEEARRHLLSNPVKMKQLEKLVEQQREMKLKAAKMKKKKKRKKRKKKKSKDSDSSSSSDDSEDELVNRYLSILTQKKGSQSDTKHKLSVEDHQGGKKNSERKLIDRDREKSAENHRHVDRIDSESRDISIPRKSRHRHDSTDNGAVEEKKKRRRSHSPRHRPNKRDEESSADKKRSFPPATNNRQSSSEYSPDGNSQSKRHHSSDQGETKKVYGLIKNDRHSSMKSGVEVPPSKIKKSRESSSSSSSSSRTPEQSSHNKDKKHKKSLHRHRSSSNSRSRSPIRKTSSTQQKKISSRSKSPERKNSALHKKKLSEEEKAHKVQEMMENAKWRDEQRKLNVERYKIEEDKEGSRLKTYQGEAGFLKSMMSEHASNSSVEDRLKRNKYNIQRTRAALDKNFTQH